MYLHCETYARRTISANKDPATIIAVGSSLLDKMIVSVIFCHIFIIWAVGHF